MNDSSNPTTPASQPEGLVGVPVAAGGGKPTRPASAAPLPSWVAPAIVLALVVGLGVGLALGFMLGKSNDQAVGTTTTTTTSTTLAWDPAQAYGTVTVTGDALPALVTGATDTAVGLPLPDISGFDFQGDPVTISNDGHPKVIVALAHWCPHCNNELPLILDWYNAGLPGGIEAYSLSVYATPGRANFPPAIWLADADWTLPVIADDQAGTLVQTLGIPAVPFWLLVNTDGTVLQRGTGEVPATTLDAIVAELVGGSTTTQP
jgi:cytochrome c biogenesis protein CcmG/thiol:disulfide interchange protein DsbE